VGERQVFVRFAKCDLRCAFCDTPESFPTPKTARVQRDPGAEGDDFLPNPVPFEAIAAALARLDAPRGLHRAVHVTGGEPLLHPRAVRATAAAAHDLGLRVHLETGGHRPQALLEVLGAIDEATPDLKLESASLSREAGTFVVDLVSPQGPAHLDGELRAGKLLVAKPKGLTAHFSLGPLTSERFVGRLVPLICEVAKPQGAAPASVEVDALAFPLDGDLAKLDGLLRVDLGEVSYALLPGLKGLFGAQAPKPVRLPAFSVPIQKGVVRYDKLLVPIGGREYSFHGSFNLVDGELNFGTSIPLELLGVKVSSELDKARGLIDGKTLVPIEIRGPWNKPRFAVGKGFLDDVVKKALGGALEHGLEDLLKKKKPKKD